MPHWQTFSEVSNHHYGPDLERSYSNLSKQPLTMIYNTAYDDIQNHQTSFGCNRFRRSEDILELSYFDYICPHCDLDLQDSEAIVLNDALAHDDVPSYRQRLQRVIKLISATRDRDCSSRWCTIKLSSKRIRSGEHITQMMMMMSWCLMSSDVIWHIRDKLWPMPKHGSIKSTTYVRCMRV